MKKTVYIGILTTLALVISLFESVMPLPFLAPGAKLGLSNIVILVSLVSFGFREAFLVGCLKSFALMLVTGSVSSMFYSLAGSILSTTAMYLGLKFLSNQLSLIGISILGAASHNFAQILVAALVTENSLMFTYLPILIIVGLFTGFFVGLASIYVSRQLKKVNIGEFYDQR